MQAPEELLWKQLSHSKKYFGELNFEEFTGYYLFQINHESMVSGFP
jgi:hypothetical protein